VGREANLATCGTCLAQQCGQQILKCLQSPTCRATFQCAAQKCVAGGNPHPQCLLQCSPDPAGLLPIVGIVTCATNKCGDDCATVLGGIGGGLGGGGGGGGPTEAERNRRLARERVDAWSMSGTGSRRRGFAVTWAMLLAGSFLLVALTAPGAFADEPTPAQLREARELFARAVKAEKAGDWDAALQAVAHVAQIKVTPGIRFHLALAEEKTGRLVAALADYAMAEKQATDENNRDVLAALREPIAALQARVPRLVVKAPPDVERLEVSLDGKVLAPGLYAAEMPVDPKPHTVEARAPGKKPFTQTVASQERDTKTVDIVLEDEAKIGPAPAPPVPLAGGAQTPPPPPVTPPPPATSRRARAGPARSSRRSEPSRSSARA
jgi:hypothetical protein